MDSGIRRALLLPALLAAVWTAPAAAVFPIEETRADETGPRIAWDSAGDRFLTVWNTGGGVQGRFVDRGGRTVGTSFPILWPRSGFRERFTYDQAAVTFKTRQNRFFVAAREKVRREIGPGGAFLEHFNIVVKVLDQNGSSVGRTRFVHDGITGRSEPSHPTIVADTYGTDCCILVAWEDAVTRDVAGQLVDADGADHRGLITIADSVPPPPRPPARARFVNPSAVYHRAWDFFFVVFEGDRDAGVTFVGGRGVTAFGGSVFAEIMVRDRRTSDSGGARPQGRPVAAYNDDLELFAVVWFDQPTIDGALLELDGPTPVPFEFFRVNRSGFWSAIPIDGPSLVSVDGTDRFRVFVNERSRFGGDRISTVSYRIDVDSVGRARSVRSVVTGFASGVKENAVAAYSRTADRILVAWQKFTNALTNANDIWAETTAG